ncbi:MAG: multidrug efflux RND transporter permease subunit [Magnetospirillum sp.]|nr:multidrug efflux RND transporter permease subunit [Magnetospirillum sp.]
MSISTPFIHRPVATTLIMLAIMLAGIVAYPHLPVAPLPQVDFPTIQISANLPGASPVTMASSVAAPLERQFSQIPGVAQMTSTSNLGGTTVSLQFDLERNIDAAAQDVLAAINAAGGQLPKDMPSPPTIRKVNPADTPVVTLGVHSDLVPLPQVSDVADNILAQQISRLPGVGQVTINGERKPAIRIQIIPDRIAALGLSLEDIRAIIGQVTVDRPKGALSGPHRALTIYANDQLSEAAGWRDTIIAYRNDGPVRLGDVGRVVEGAENERQGGWPNGHPGVTLFVFKQPGSNVIETADRVKASLEQIRTAISPAIHVEVLTDRTQTIRASVLDVQFTLLLSIALVVMTIFVFLRNLWATVIPSITVPLALTGTFAVMYLAGYSLDNLSLMALTIAVGFVVDDAIVMLENIYRYLEEGMRPLDAALKGAREIGFTIISISLSLIAVFIPVLLMGGIVGRLLREFAFTVSMTIVVSAVVSLTLTPMLCARVLKSEHNVRHGRFYALCEDGFNALLEWYRRGLDWVLRHQGVTLASFVATVALTGALFVAIPKGFFPQQDTGLIAGTTEGPQDVSFEQMRKYQLALNQVISEDPDVLSFSSGMGGGTQNNGRIFIMLKPHDERTATADEVVARLRRATARVEGAQLFLQVVQDINMGGRSSRTQYQYTLQHINIDELNAFTPKMLEKMRALPQLRDVATDQQTGGGTLAVTIDRAQAARFGISPATIDETLYDAFGQRQVAQYFTQLNSYRILLEVVPEMQGDAAVLDKLHVKSPSTGQQVPLSALVRYDTKQQSYLSINHQGQFPAVTLSFNLAPGVALGDAIDAIKGAEGELARPDNLIATFQGTAQAFQSSLASTPYLILAAVVAVYIILGVLYESFIHPLTILSTLPSAGAGALIFLMAFRHDLSVIAIIGILLLIGIVKKNGIMVVDFAIDAQRRLGLGAHEAIRQACLLRFRPIIMTTFAALLGGLPLMIGHGAGSELRQPLGVAMVGGLAVSQILTLFTTPVIYLAFERLRRDRRAPAPLLVEDGLEAAEAAE